MKTIFVILFAFFTGVSFSQAKTIEVLRDQAGYLFLVDHYTANGINRTTKLKDKPDICEQAGKGRLPTIRELAEFSRSRGAVGILDESQINSDLRGKSNPIEYINSYGQEEKVYFYALGFQPDDSLRSYYWSSSVFSFNDKYAHILNGSTGDLGEARRWDRLYVVCVPSIITNAL